MSAPFTSAAPSAPTGGSKRLNYRQQLSETYKNSLPVVPPSLPSPPPPRSLPPTVIAALAQTYFNNNTKKDLKGKSVKLKLENPRCVGIWDSFTGSVWVKGKRDGEILWTRGNFGKGSLSRSEPSWWKRTVRELTGSGNGECRCFVSEEGRRREGREEGWGELRLFRFFLTRRPSCLPFLCSPLLGRNHSPPSSRT